MPVCTVRSFLRTPSLSLTLSGKGTAKPFSLQNLRRASPDNKPVQQKARRSVKLSRSTVQLSTACSVNNPPPTPTQINFLKRKPRTEDRDAPALPLFAKLIPHWWGKHFADIFYIQLHIICHLQARAKHSRGSQAPHRVKNIPTLQLK